MRFEQLRSGLGGRWWGGACTDCVASPAPGSGRLTAEAREVSLAGRTGVYDVNVHNQRGEAIAVFRGRSYCMKGKHTVPLADTAR